MKKLEKKANVIASLSQGITIKCMLLFINQISKRYLALFYYNYYLFLGYRKRAVIILAFYYLSAGFLALFSSLLSLAVEHEKET